MGALDDKLKPVGASGSIDAGKKNEKGKGRIWGGLTGRFLYTDNNQEKKEGKKKNHGRSITFNEDWSKGAQINLFSNSMVKTAKKENQLR